MNAQPDAVPVVDAAFDGGNIRLIAIGDRTIDVEIVRDNASDFYQWFHFEVKGLAGGRWTIRILNAAGSAYPMGWPGYSARASTDGDAWRQVPTRYVDGVLSFDWDAAAGDPVRFAYFAPYTTLRHRETVGRFATAPGFAHRILGRSLDGAPIDALTVGTGPRPAWFYARQHPGESMCEWFMEGALERLADMDDATTRALRDAFTFHLVPNMNPDGTRRGHLRTNAAGVNLNREWHAPSAARSPEVVGVLAAMDESGVAYAMDVHGDEAIPANFIAGFEGIPGLTEAQGALFDAFGRRLAAHTPDFQTALGYGATPPGRANLSMSTNQIAERFGALAMTLEMPFKDHDPNPDPEFGWSPARSKALAHASLEVLATMVDLIPPVGRR